MTLTLLDSVNRVLAAVKTLTGKEVQFIEKKDLQTYAAVRMARQSMPAHLMIYKPEHSEIINHLVVHECGHVLRMFGVPEEQRLVAMTNNQIKLEALKSIEPDVEALSKTMPFQGLAQIVNLWYDGTVRQLTSYPSDFMIEKWIYDKYPDLRPFQLQSLRRQYDEAVQALSPRVEKLTPRLILTASNAMNYAFFVTMGAYLKVDYFKRYEFSPYAKLGKELIRVRDEAPDDYRGDIETANKWASILGISGWFKWTGFEDIPNNYRDAA